MRRLLAVAAGLTLVPALAAPASASSERMQLACQDGRIIERSNGSSWWGVDHAAGYVTEHLLVTSGGQVQYEKDYGRKGAGARSTCVADHFGSTWTVQLVRTR
ncbi:MAG TPA: hypothetical protein VM433_14645 [Mycobacteriales bacterium]|nr:hypothetical protein [Mycobacteriales bacterium]